MPRKRPQDKDVNRLKSWDRTHIYLYGTRVDSLKQTPTPPSVDVCSECSNEEGSHLCQVTPSMLSLWFRPKPKEIHRQLR